MSENTGRRSFVLRVVNANIGVQKRQKKYYSSSIGTTCVSLR
jgi:hypothetical protein